MADVPAEQGTKAAAASGHGLQKKLGPLPIWAWAAVVIGSYLLFHYLKNRSAAASTVGGTVSGGNNAASTGLQIQPNGDIVDPTTGDIVGTVGTGNTTGGASDTSTVQGWLAAAQTALQGLGLDNNTINGALNDYVAGNPLPQAEYNIVQEAQKIIGTAPAALGNPALAPPAPAPAPAPAPQAPATPALPSVDASLWPKIIQYGQWTTAQFTKIGTVTNGQYQGINVSGGVPVYANVFGGLAQGFDEATLPSGTDLYIPTQYLAYENPSGTQNAANKAA